jgi:hypothetical protein
MNLIAKNIRARDGDAQVAGKCGACRGLYGWVNNTGLHLLTVPQAGIIDFNLFDVCDIFP